MKTLQVMDLFYGDCENEIGEWNEFNEENQNTHPQPKSSGCKVKVKNFKGNQCFAYYFQDKAQWVAQYGVLEPSYFWHCNLHIAIKNISHWKGVEGGM